MHTKKSSSTLCSVTKMRGIKRPKNKIILPFSQNLFASAWHPSFSNILSKLVQISSLQKVTQRGLTSFSFKMKVKLRGWNQKNLVKMLFDFSVKIYCVFALERSQTKLNNFRARSF